MYQITGASLLKYSNIQPIPVEQSFGGEAGIFYFVPLIATFLNISALDATWFFLFLQVVTGVIVSGIAFLLMAKTLLGRCIVLIGVSMLGFVAWFASDVYVTYFFTVSFFPWILVLLEKKNYKMLCAYSFVLGLIIEYGNFVRSFSGLPLLVGALVLILFAFRFSRKTFLLLVFLFFGIGLVKGHIYRVIQNRNKYLKTQGYIVEQGSISHTFWHAVYCGLGFISNNKGIDFSDTCSAQKVKLINSHAQYLGFEYEMILRNEVWKLCLYSPNYVLRVLFAKIGVLFYYFLLFANVGLIAAYYARKPFYIELSYGVMLLVSALPGLLTIPNILYLIGFVSVATLYGIHSIIYMLNTEYS